MSYSILLPALLSMALTQAEAGRGLYAVQPGENERLVRIALDRDNNLQQETVLATNRGKPDFFKWEKIELIGDRYVVSGYGGVVDIKNRKIINDERKWGRLLGIDGQKVVYGFFDASPDGLETPKDRRGIFTFDLQTEKRQKLDKPGNWNLPGVWSPDKSLGATVGTDPNGPFSLHQADGTSRILAEGFKINYAKIIAYQPAKVPILWLDNEHILTQKKNGLLVVLDLKGNAHTVAEIKDAPEVLGPPQLSFDPQKRIIYSMRAERKPRTYDIDEYLVDVKAKSAVRLDKYALGHGFEASVKPVDGHYSVFHEGKLIGKRAEAVNPYCSRTGPGVIGYDMAWPGYGKGVAVWDARLGDWREIRLESTILVGWSK